MVWYAPSKVFSCSSCKSGVLILVTDMLLSLKHFVFNAINLHSGFNYEMKSVHMEAFTYVCADGLNQSQTQSSTVQNGLEKDQIA